MSCRLTRTSRPARDDAQAPSGGKGCSHGLAAHLQQEDGDGEGHAEVAEVAEVVQQQRRPGGDDRLDVGADRRLEAGDERQNRNDEAGDASRTSRRSSSFPRRPVMLELG